MRGCLRAVGCLVVLLVVACAAAWFSRDWWLAKAGLRPSRQVTAATWEAPADAGARRADAALKRLASPTGPAFANLSPGELLSYLEKEIGRALPKSVDSLQASVVGDRLYVRFRIDSDAVSKDKTGPIAFLRGHQRIAVGGTLHVIRPGRAELQVKDVSIGSWRIPRGLIPNVLKQFAGDRPADASSDGIAVATPDYIGDVRIANGRITVYKTVPPKQ